MSGLDFGPGTFGALNAEDYDALHDPGNTGAAVEMIAGLAGPGPVLELAIGTGRVALPLAARGVAVEGVEGAPEMVAKLKEKPGGADIPVVIGDMADVPVKGLFSHVFLVFNTLFNLTSQEAQVRCFKNVADRLMPGGSFLIETFVPDLEGFDAGQRVQTKRLDRESVWVEAATHDPIGQLFEFQRIRIDGDGIRLVPLQMRYAWPSEIDLMARLAGLTLEARWSDFEQSPFTSESAAHVSLYRKARE